MAPDFFTARLCRRVLVLSAAFQTLVVLATAQYVRSPFFPDAQSYDELGRAVARHWELSQTLSTTDLASITGTRTWGAYAFFGAVYSLFGEDWLYARLALALVASTAAGAIFVLASHIVPNRRAVIAVVVVATVYPTFAFWSAVGLKDAAVTALGFSVLALHVAVRPPFGPLLATAASLLLLPVRPVLAGSLFIALLFGRATREHRMLRWARVGAALAILGILFLPTGQRLGDASGYLSAGVGFGRVVGNEGVTVVEGGLAAQVLSALDPANVLQGVFGPRPWHFGEDTAAAYRWMYPGTAIWIACFPAALIGAALGIRRGDSPARTLVVFAAVYAAAYYVTFADGFARQRTPIEMVGLVFTGLAFVERRELVVRATTVWMFVVAFAALVEVDPLAGALTTLVLGGVLLAQRLRAVRRTGSVLPRGARAGAP